MNESSIIDDEIKMQNVVQGGLVINKLLYSDTFIGGNRLEFALETTTFSTHPYSTYPKEWPQPVEVVDKWELPTGLKEKYNASSGEGITLCGIFPEIRRAWAAVNNSLFLWGFDKWCRERECLEYNAGKRVICAVGLAKSRVSVETIQYLLVLATPLELILVGVCCSRINNGGDPYEELSLQPLPDYTLSSDGVVMTCITCTDDGRIFLAGCDGHIYELKYIAEWLWQKRCRKVRLTSRLDSAISRLIFNNAVDPAVKMVFDNEKRLLYAITKAMKLQIFYLGENGDELEKVGVERRFMMKHEGPHIVSVSPVSQLESTSLQLVVVLSDGRRLYYELADWRFFESRPPNSLDLVSIRPSPILEVAGVPLAGHFKSDDFSLKVRTSHYSAGTLVLSHPSPSMSSSLIIVSKDYSTQPSRAGHIGTLVRNRRALWESVTHLQVEGKVLYVADALALPETSMTLDSLYQSCTRGFWKLGKLLEKSLWARRDLSLQHILPRRRVVVFSTMGMTELVFNRPVDTLRSLLESNPPKEEALEYFFKRFGTAEASAMCLLLAANIADSEISISNMVVDKATQIYENPKFVGMPQLSVQEADPEIVFSGAYEGLCFCLARLLYPLWRYCFVSCECCSDSYVKCRKPVQCTISVRAMQVLENKVRSLEKFLRLRRIQRKGLYARLSISDDFATMEIRATECLRQLLLRCGEALFLLQLLSKHYMALLVPSIGDRLKIKLRKLKFEGLVCSEDGHVLATRLISALFEYYTGCNGGGTVDDLIKELCKGCPSYFTEKNHKFYSAMDCLERAAESSNTTERDNLAREAFNFFNQHPESGDLQLICKKFEHLRFYEAVVRLPLQKAQALDPDGNAANEQIDQASRDHALAQRETCYQVIVVAVRHLNAERIIREFGFLSLDKYFVDQSSRKKYIQQIVELSVHSSDRIFQEYLYRSLIDMGLENELLEYAAPALDFFFQHAVFERINEVYETPLSTKANYLRLKHRVALKILRP